MRGFSGETEKVSVENYGHHTVEQWIIERMMHILLRKQPSESQACADAYASFDSQDPSVVLSDVPSRNTVTGFIKPGTQNHLFAWCTGGKLACSTSIPTWGRNEAGNKVACFIKHVEHELTVDNVDKTVSFMTMSPRTALLDTFRLYQEIVYPSIVRSDVCNGRTMNGDTATSSASYNVTVEAAFDTLSKTCAAVSLSSGQTYLALPLGHLNMPLTGSTVDEASLAPQTNRAPTKKQLGSICRQDTSVLLESYVLLWSRQIECVLAEEVNTVPARLNAANPVKEIDYWRARETNLSFIAEQLSSDEVRSVCDALRTSGGSSEIVPALLAKVQVAQEEASCMARHMKPLRDIAVRVEESTNFDADVQSELPKFFKQLSLLWLAADAARRVPARVLTLITQFFDAIMIRAKQSFDDVNIFTLDPMDAKNRLDIFANVCTALRLGLEACERWVAVNSNSEDSMGTTYWSISTDVALTNVERHHLRAKRLVEVIQNRLRFTCLDGLVLANGVTGLDDEVLHVHRRVFSAIDEVEKLECDFLDPDFRVFDTYADALERELDVADKRVASVLSRALDESTTITGMLDLVQSVEPILQRPNMVDTKERMRTIILQAWLDEIAMLRREFATQWQDPPRPSNTAPVSGAIVWARGLRTKAFEPQASFSALFLCNPTGDGTQNDHLAQNVNDQLMRLRQRVNSYEAECFKSWTSEVESSVQEKLLQPLLRRGTMSDDSNKYGDQDEDAGHLRVNFDPSLGRLLREVKHLLQIGMPIPKVAMSIYGDAELFRTQIANLELVVADYNTVLVTLDVVERGLLSTDLKFVEEQLIAATEAMTWKSSRVDDFIRNSLSLTSSATAKIKKLKSNMSCIVDMFEAWNKMFHVFGRPKAPFNSDEFIEECKKIEMDASAEVRRGNQQIHKLLHDSKSSLKISKSAQPWIAYVMQTSQLIQASLCNIVVSSLDNLLSQIAATQHLRSCDGEGTKEGGPEEQEQRDDEHDKGSLLQIKLRLVVSSVQGVDRRASLGGNTGEAKECSVAHHHPFISFDPPLLTERRKPAATSHLADNYEGNGDLSGIEERGHANGLPLQDLMNWLSDTESGDAGVEGQQDAAVRQASFKGGWLTQEDGQQNSPESIEEIITKWIIGFFDGVANIKRLERPSKNYVVAIVVSEVIKSKIQVVREMLGTSFESLRSFGDSYRAFDHLWSSDENAVLRTFLEEHKQQLTLGSGDNVALGPTKPSSEMADSMLVGIRKFCALPPLGKFEENLKRYAELHDSVTLTADVESIGWIAVNTKPLKDQIRFYSKRWTVAYAKCLSDALACGIDSIESYERHITATIEAPDADQNSHVLIESLKAIRSVEENAEFVEHAFDRISSAAALVARYSGQSILDALAGRLEAAPTAWATVKERCNEIHQTLTGSVAAETERLMASVQAFGCQVGEANATIQANLPTSFKIGRDAAVEMLDSLDSALSKLRDEKERLNDLERLFRIDVSSWSEIETNLTRCTLLRGCWDMVKEVNGRVEEWKNIAWDNIDADRLLLACKDLQKKIVGLPRDARSFGVYDGILTVCKNMLTSLPLVQELHDGAVQRHHWNQLMRIAGCKIDLDQSFTLGRVLSLNLHAHQDDVLQITEQARQERKIEMQLDKITIAWDAISLEFEEWQSPATREGGVVPWVLKPADEIVETLEDHLVTLQNLSASKYITPFKNIVARWKMRLSNLDNLLGVLIEVQRSWQSLESIFLLSEDIRQQLYEDAERFVLIDSRWLALVSELRNTTSVLDVATEERKACLGSLQSMLELCEKSLSDYLEVKRRAFPRFYFMSRSDLVDILSKGSYPQQVQRHLPALFSALGKLKFAAEEGSPGERTAIGAWATDGEWLEFDEPLECDGQVESWLSDLLDMQRRTLRTKINNAIEDWPKTDLNSWVLRHCSQAALTASQVWFTRDVTEAFEKLEDGHQGALKECLNSQQKRLRDLTQLTMSDLGSDDRRKVVTMITVMVHARDVIQRLISDKVESSSAFAWQSQLRYFVDDDQPNTGYGSNRTAGCRVNIADASFDYGYEWVGNCSRLVITPLTDRCYITLTQAMRLVLGGAPAGPAGTGKTETVKDLGRALGFMVYVFNCSSEMTFESMGQIFSGLCQTGAWGCFDEFNRISIEVLSVVAEQYSSILSALRAKKTMFNFMGKDINLVPSVGAFITMNPGYKGRTELPENIKSLFRPVAMVVPDLENICEIMLQAEGFVEAKMLAHKFVVLYRLSKELLSQQSHYDWGLRAVKSVLVVAGNLRRADPDLPEDAVLMRALRDFNLPKIVIDDVSIFMGLLVDLFPGVDPPRKVNAELERAVREVIAEEGSGLQEVEAFVLKVVQLAELLEVRHSVFVLGPPGCGKTAVWRTLAEAQAKLGRKTDYQVLNPKAVSTADLYGYMHPVTKEYKDGLLANMMRSFSRAPGDDQRWIVLDGDIDAEWIESMNTVMDDNKVLTLVSNERIVLTPNMRLIFEIGDLKNATPATVSRAGILFINDTDTGWQPVVKSWAQGLSRECAHLYQTCDSDDVENRPNGATHDENSGLAATSDDDRDHAGLFLRDIMEVVNLYLARAIEMVAVGKLKRIVDMSDVHAAQTTCKLFESQLARYGALPENRGDSIKTANSQAVEVGTPTASNTPRITFDLLRSCCAFATMWGVGGSLRSDAHDDARRVFSEWWQNEFSGNDAVVPAEGFIWDHVYDVNLLKWNPWSSRVTSNYNDDSVTDPSSTPYVDTAASLAVRYVMGLLVDVGQPVMLAGGTGTGKSALMRSFLNDYLGSSPDSERLQKSLVFNARTDAIALQGMIDDQVEKKVGNLYGPPANKELVLYLDDINMPLPDKWGTQSGLALLRQIIDSGRYYDLSKLGARMIQKVCFMASMNPTSGSFTIDPRLQRHFAVIAWDMPAAESLTRIYGSILSYRHGISSPILLSGSERGVGGGVGGGSGVAQVVISTVNAMVDLHNRIVEAFKPSASTFHYQFDLRSLSNVMQGLMLASSEWIASSNNAAHLLAHECTRVYHDRLISSEHQTHLLDLIVRTLKDHFDVDESLLAPPNIFTSFVDESSTDRGIGNRLHADSGDNGGAGGVCDTYVPVESWDALGQAVESKLVEYNETNVGMDLVLFEEALSHVSRISRVLERPGSSCMLVGVGGSGKQSLGRLASFICGHEVYQMTVTQSFSMQDFREHVNNLYSKAGIKGISTVFLITDQQIVHEDILVNINDILASGESPGLFTPEEREAFINAVRGEVKQLGGIVRPTNDQCWQYFIGKVRRNLHFLLCFSPVGDNLRVQCRRYPALMNCTTIDWFHPWPASALHKVAFRFIRSHTVQSASVDPGAPSGCQDNNELDSDSLCESIASHMSYVHQSVTEACSDYAAAERRHNYTTPKTFLELIALFKVTLQEKANSIVAARSRLSNGLDKLTESTAEVAVMQEQLEAEQVEVEKKKAITDELLQRVGEEAAKADKAADEAAVEEAKISEEAVRVQAFEEQCRHDLEAAEPAVAAAMAALNTLDKSSLGVLKTLGRPPEDVQDVAAAVAYLMAPPNTDLRKLDVSWTTVKTKLMGSLPGFMNDLMNFDKDQLPSENRAIVEVKYMNKKSFEPEAIKQKSQAASGLCAWVRNIVEYNKIFLDVKPKRMLLEKSQAELVESQNQLVEVKKRVAELQERKEKLKAELRDASEEKARLELKARNTQKRLALAERLVGGLKDENVRWTQSRLDLDEEKKTLVGDVLLASSFIAYIGPFNKDFRHQLVTERWIPDLESKLIPISRNVDVKATLASPSKVATWLNQGLPSDPLSIENAAIVTTCTRWPLLIDPQLQAKRWLENMEGDNGLKTVSANHRGSIKAIIQAMQQGYPCLLEGVGESLDPVLDPLLSRAVIRRGASSFICLGQEEVELDPNFRLYIHTSLPNPHYRPEVAAQTTIVNFSVTEQGLEDQLLAVVVKKEESQLEVRRLKLVRELNEYSIMLQQLEDDLLAKLSDSQGDILSNEALIVGLETTKNTALEIQQKQAEAKKTEVVINQSRNSFLSAATRGSLLFFLITDLTAIDHMYQFSLSAFMGIFSKALDKSEASEEKAQRLSNIVDSVTLTVFCYVTRCLYERHRLIFSTQLALKVALKAGIIDQPAKVSAFLSGNSVVASGTSPLPELIPDTSWAAVRALSDLEGLGDLLDDIKSAPKRWEGWLRSETPEDEPLPSPDLKRAPIIDKLLVIRALRPDRVAKAVSELIQDVLGSDYVAEVPFDLQASLEDTSANVPIFFFLSAGVNPLGDVWDVAPRLGVDVDSIMSISLGQGQEAIADEALSKAAAQGNWLVLQNIELASKWMNDLEARLVTMSDQLHPRFRLFLTAQPSDRVPVALLQRSIKLTNEPPQGLRANMLRAFGTFGEDVWEQSPKQNELKQILFTLCFFHSVVIERRKFGPQGWNRTYPFNQGDLSVCIRVLNNYLDTCVKIPWDDLRYIFGEIMYGGHITDDWDRRLCTAYLQHYIRPELIETGITLFPGFESPPPLRHDDFIELIRNTFVRDTPDAFGMHPNAEIGFNTAQGEYLCSTILKLNGQNAFLSGGVGSEASRATAEVLETLPATLEVRAAVDRLGEGERDPFATVFAQECELLNVLLDEIRSSLIVLDRGLRGELTISDDMETLIDALISQRVPDQWAAKAYPSERGLRSWLTDLARRHAQLLAWCESLAIPPVVWISGFFNPQSFLTAVMQKAARKHGWPLDHMTVETEPIVLPAEAGDDFSAMKNLPSDGTLVRGLYCEGAKWDTRRGCLAEMELKDLTPEMPPILIRPVPVDKARKAERYICPVYKTRERGPTYVFSAPLKTKSSPTMWTMAGVALIMDVGQ